jgi:hypothetical protein
MLKTFSFLVAVLNSCREMLRYGHKAARLKQLKLGIVFLKSLFCTLVLILAFSRGVALIVAAF